jgi:hypothetical protein
MPETSEALGILLVLLPGFACSYIVQLIGARRKRPEFDKQTELDKVIEALLFSLLLYIACLPFFGLNHPLDWKSPASNQPGPFQFQIQYAHLATLAGLAVILALLYSAAISHGWLRKAIEWMRITEPTAHAVLHDRWVQVGISGGRSLIGWLRNYPDKYSEIAAEDFYIFEQAAWVVKDANGREVEVEIEGVIMIPEATEIEYVIYLGGKSTR